MCRAELVMLVSASGLRCWHQVLVQERLFKAMRANLFALAIALIAGSAFAVAQSYDGQAADGDYAIEEPEQLRALGEVAQSFSFSNSTFTLGADIDLSDYGWTPIGSESAPFTGTFRGNGHKITGLCVNSATNNAGLFGVVSNATIEGVSVSGSVAGCKRVAEK